MSEKELMPIVYVAGNYSNGGKASHEEMRVNRDILRYYATVFIRNGWAVICPIENDLWAYDLGLINYDECLGKDFAFINRCDAIFFCPGWQQSKGAKLEYEFAMNQAKHVYTFYDINDERIKVDEFRKWKTFIDNKRNLHKVFIENVQKNERPRNELGRFSKVNK